MLLMKMYSLYHSLCILTLVRNLGAFVVFEEIGDVLLLLGLFLLLVAFVGNKNFMVLLYGGNGVCYRELYIFIYGEIKDLYSIST